MNLSEKVKKLRAENNVTQEQLTKKLQVSRSTISSWETGRGYPDLEMKTLLLVEGAVLIFTFDDKSLLTIFLTLITISYSVCPSLYNL